MSQKVVNEVWSYAPESGDSLVILLAIAAEADDTGQAIITWDWLEKRCRLQGQTLLYELFFLDIRGELTWDGHIQSYPRDKPFTISIPLPIKRIEGFVYLIRCGPYYKIGRTKDLSTRIPQLAIQLPHPLLIVHTIPTDNPIELETELHDQFSEKRLNGEWFALDRDDVEEITGLAEMIAGAKFEKRQ
jgi:Meiotically up-regulated gene 113